VNKVLLEPLPYPDPSRLVQLIAVSAVGDQALVSIPKYLVWRNHSSAFQYIAAYDTAGPAVGLTQNGHSDLIKVARVSADYFPLFGASLAAGRTFSAQEDRPGGPRVAVIGGDLWRKLFGNARPAAGIAISLEHQSYRVVGVLAAGFMPFPFSGDAAANVWLPLQADPSAADHVSRVRVSARLKPGLR
jgi:hypothetical protein